MKSISFNQTSRDGVTVLAVSGEIDLLTSDEFETHLNEALAQPNRIVVLDLSHVRFIGSVGLSVLISSAETGRSDGVDLRLVTTERVILRPVEIAGVDHVLPVFDSVAAALHDVKDDKHT